MFKIVGGRVDVRLDSMRTTKDVFWSPTWEGSGGARGGCNSFVMVETEYGSFLSKDGKTCALMSINGIGEVRWDINKSRIQQDVENSKESWWKDDQHGENIKAAKHFGLLDE